MSTRQKQTEFQDEPTLCSHCCIVDWKREAGWAGLCPDWLPHMSGQNGLKARQSGYISPAKGLMAGLGPWLEKALPSVPARTLVPPPRPDPCKGRREEGSGPIPGPIKGPGLYSGPQSRPCLANVPAGEIWVWAGHPGPIRTPGRAGGGSVQDPN